MNTLYKESKFIFDSHNMKLIEGKLPTKKGQLCKGENQENKKMEIVFYYTASEENPYVYYWGWSDDT